MPRVNKLYACCMDQGCAGYKDALSFLQTWGLELSTGEDKTGPYFDVSAPPYWLANRKRRFQEALEQRPPVKHGKVKAKAKDKPKAKAKTPAKAARSR